MLAEGGTERQVEKRPNLTASKNTERQKVLPPSASDCHSVPEWLSSPSRMVPIRCFHGKYYVSAKRWRKKWRVGLVARGGRGSQEDGAGGSSNTPPAAHTYFFEM